MPEFRQNLATKEWVIVATERAKRPQDFQKKGEAPPFLPPHKPNCPFCIGNEEQTPPAVFTITRDGRWGVRVVPNKFAALKPDLATTRTNVGKFLQAEGFGVAEVIIETPEHHKTIATLSEGEVEDILQAYQHRYLEISKVDKVNLITIFRNFGVRAGTSLEHPHSQLIATPIVPPHVRDPFRQAMLHYDEHGSCVYCDMVAEELRQGKRIVLESEHFVALCPFAARTPFETRVYPKAHKASYGSISEDERGDLAGLLRAVMGKLRTGLGNPDYNYIIRSSPIGDENVHYLHWYMVVIPKVSTAAGFEIGTGIYINVVAPEESAKFLREVVT